MDLLDSIADYIEDEEVGEAERGIEIVNENDITIEDVKDNALKQVDGSEEAVSLANFESDGDGGVTPSIQSPANINNKAIQEAISKMTNEQKIKPKRYNPKKKSKKKIAKQSRMNNRKK